MCSVLKLLWLTYFILEWLPASSCQTLLLATDGGIKFLEPLTSVLTTIHENSASAVDFRYKNKDIYFVSGNQIFYSYYSRYTGSHANPIPIIAVTHSLTDVVVDWKSFRLYSSSSSNGVIYESALLGVTVTPLMSSHAEVRDLAIDVFDRRLFYIKEDKLHVSLLHSRDSISSPFLYHFRESPRITKVTQVAVDHHRREVYVVGYDDEQFQWHLISTDYNNTLSKQVFNGSELAEAFALTVFDLQVIWGSLAHGKYTLYSCKMTPDCDIDHLEIIYQSEEAINDVKFYNPLVQTPDTESACKELNCSHNCTLVSPYTVRCSCPQGMVVDLNGNSCADEPPSIRVSLWYRVVQIFLTLLEDAVVEWVTSLTPYIVALILIVCVVMAVLLTCGLCIMACTRSPKRSVELTESYSLSETRTRSSSR